MFVLAFAILCILSFWFMVVLMESGAPPILAGQRWKIPGLGVVTIMKALSASEKFPEGAGKGSNVVYCLDTGLVGYCLKPEIYQKGILLPYDKGAIQQAVDKIKRKSEIDGLLKLMEDKRAELGIRPSSYAPPAGWVKPKSNPVVTIAGTNECAPEDKDVVEAEVIYPKQFGMSIRNNKRKFKP
jgi:hypothetical protein